MGVLLHKIAFEFKGIPEQIFGCDTQPGDALSTHTRYVQRKVPRHQDRKRQVIMIKYRFQLHPVRDFRRTTDIGQIRQNGFLIDRSQNHVRAQLFRMLSHQRVHFLCRERQFCIYDAERAVFPALNAFPQLIVEIKQVDVAG